MLSVTEHRARATVRWRKRRCRSVADITRLSKNNNGALPYDYLYKVIDGRETGDAHGPRDMPHWGLLYSDEANPGVTKEEFVRARITALIAHIATLQEK